MAYFTNREPGLDNGRYEELHPELLRRIEIIREYYQHPIHVNSSYRSPSNPIEAAKKKPGTHAKGWAVDIQLHSGQEAFELVEYAYKVGFRRIGIKRKSGTTSGLIHLDIGDLFGLPDSIWTY